MNEHSLDNLIEKIYNSKSKEYFQEVIKTYYTYCYRSSLVMLYTVVICDLIYKLEELRDVYNDNTAKKILTEVENIQNTNPKSPDWENKIVELISQRTKLLEISDVENINQVQKHRHLSAHPVLNQTSLLFKPNKETVKAHIINMLEGVLTKPPILSTKIFNELINDLAANKYRFTNDEELKRFLNAKYFKNLRQETLNDIYKKLWKFVFKIENDECNRNRDINLKSLEVIFNHNQKEILKLLKSEETYFNGVLKGICMEYLIKHTFKYPTIFKSLSEITRSEIEYETKHSINFKFISWFLFDSVEEFHSSLINDLKKVSSFYIDSEYFRMLESLYNEFNLQNEYHDLCITIFVKSISFDEADYNFQLKIEPHLQYFTEAQFETLIKGINNNFQVNGRNQAQYNNRKIKEFCDKILPKNFDYSKYQGFKI